MPAIILDGDALAAKLRSALASQVRALHARAISPKLATIFIGADPASASYIARKHADCAEIGIASSDIRLPDTISQAELLFELGRLNADSHTHGIMVQLPLPDHIAPETVIEAIAPHKDVDGLHPLNLGRLITGRPTLLPCTAAAILALLDAYEIATAGRSVAIIGRGALVGRPLSILLSQPGRDATVTVLHRQSPSLAAVTRTADIVISAAGHPGLVTAAMLKPGATAIGVGISYIDGKMVSDVADDVQTIASHVTPQHGSVGPLTRAMLLKNLLLAASLGGDF